MQGVVEMGDSDKDGVSLDVSGSTVTLRTSNTATYFAVRVQGGNTLTPVSGNLSRTTDCSSQVFRVSPSTGETEYVMELGSVESDTDPVILVGYALDDSKVKLISNAPIPSPTPSPTPSSDACVNDFCSQDISIGTLTWRLIENSTKLDIWIKVHGSRWVALGWSESGSMAGTNAVIYRPSKDPISAAQFLIQDYGLPGDMSPSEVLKIAEGSIVTVQQQPTESDDEGATELGFIVDFDKDIVQKYPLVFASGDDNAFGYHGKMKGSVQVDWLSGSANVVTSSAGPSRAALNAHAALMIAGWSFLFPLGIIASRFGRGWFKETTGFWFHMHRVVQSAGLLATCVALVVMIVDHHKTGTDHFSTTHGKVGLSMMIIAICQPLNAFLRPHPSPKTLARRVWEGLHKTCGYASVVISVWNAFGGLESIWWSGYETTHDVLFNTLWSLVGLTSFAALALFVLEAKDLAQNLDYPNDAGEASDDAVYAALKAEGNGAGDV